MCDHTSSAQPSPSANAALDLIKRQAKRLHKAAQSPWLSSSLPVLRRLRAARVLTGMTLPELQRERQIVQRKHMLRMLAIEAGFDSWERYSAHLRTLAPDELQQYDVLRHDKAQLNHWFPSIDAASQYTKTHGGRAIAVGRQAVVFDAER